ncbi:hypothetical protein [Giesbergeria anulus]|uniref:Uncharacterized protein n=1 Tax=Giesbergeria anulus TaxID=180197 RepID=A0A1H9EDH8_9BURK|nr:hypothetical protein [Giesbergeria anulus]SEQ23770.1 hypothetical protein SAMN02982919_00272 [Giesbergeria anulus]
MQHFKPYENESEVIRIGNLEVENRVDRVVLMGDLVLTKDKAGLELAKELQILAARVVKVLEKQKKLPDTVQVKPPVVVENPFI